MNSKEIKQRTEIFALRIIRMTGTFPRGIVSNVITNQIVKSATSVAANYRGACRAKSKADFIAKIKIVEEEADKTLFWLELIYEIELVKRTKLKELF